jgi:hypothetical protein
LIYRNKPRPDAPSDQPIDLAYLRYIWKYPARTAVLVSELIEEHGADKPVIKLDNPKRVDSLISALQASANGVAA